MSKEQRRYGEVVSGDEFDSFTEDDLVTARNTTPLNEIGVTGLKRTSGYINEEYLPALRGQKAVKVYKEMENDPIVGALLFSITQLIRQAEWNVVAASQSEDDQVAATFVEECMDDMSHSWGDMISEVMSMLVYGWSWHEITYKQRIGPWEKDPKRKSQFTDGRIGWRKISIRGQETLTRWVFDEHGGIRAFVQTPPPRYQRITIPIEKSLLFKYKENKGSPEGVSLLRNAYRPWFLKKRIEEFEAIGIERDLAGIPMVSLPEKMFNASKGSPEAKTLAAFKKMVNGIRRDEHEGIVFPMKYDSETKQPLYKFELMSSGGARQFNTDSIIQRYEQRILMTCLADFIMVGHQGQGSYAMHVDKTGIFRTALNTIAKSIADVFNRHAIPRLFEMNGWKVESLPKIVPSNVDAPNLTELVSVMTSLASMGVEWFPDPDLEKFFRKISGLPEMPEDVMELRQEMAEQKNAISYANQAMEFLSTRQKAEMTSQGLTPEQAQMEAEKPSVEQQANDQASQYKAQALADTDPDVQAGKEQEAVQAEQESAQQQQQQLPQTEEAKMPDIRAMIEEEISRTRGKK